MEEELDAKGMMRIKSSSMRCSQSKISLSNIDIKSPTNSKSGAETPTPLPKKNCIQRVASFTWKDWLKVVVLLLILTSFALAVVYRHDTASLFTGFLDWIADNLFLGSVVFILVYAVTTVIAIPGIVFAFGAGFVFNHAVPIPFVGVLIASVLVQVGASIGATWAFLLARSLLRGVVENVRNKYPNFNTIDKIVELYGFKVTFLLRLSPAVPFNLFNYLMGLTCVRLVDYINALIGLYPGTLAFCFIGASLDALADVTMVGLHDPVLLVLLIVGTLITVVGMVWLSVYAKRKYNELKAEVEGVTTGKETAETAVDEETGS